MPFNETAQPRAMGVAQTPACSGFKSQLLPLLVMLPKLSGQIISYLCHHVGESSKSDAAWDVLGTEQVFNIRRCCWYCMKPMLTWVRPMEGVTGLCPRREGILQSRGILDEQSSKYRTGTDERKKPSGHSWQQLHSPGNKTQVPWSCR